MGRRWGPALALVLAAIALAALAPSCANPTPKQYRVLTFFFDGVPDPNAVAVDDTGAPVSVAEKRKQASTASFHPKKGGWECKRCHGQFDNKLRGGPAKLCKQCHTREKFPKGKLHGPLNVGACTACHDPHRSLNPHLLHLPVPQLCLGCHEKTITYQQIDEHIQKNGSECTRCHDPHASPRKAFLAQDPLPEGTLPTVILEGTQGDGPTAEGTAPGAPEKVVSATEGADADREDAATKAADTKDAKPGPGEGAKPDSSEAVPER